MLKTGEKDDKKGGDDDKQKGKKVEKNL